MKRFLLCILIMPLLFTIGCSNYYVGNGNILPTLNPALSDRNDSNNDDISNDVIGLDNATVGIVGIDTYFPLDTHNDALCEFLTLIYDSLVTFDSLYDVSFCLAKEIYTADGGLTWNIVLADNIRWHDNTTLNAEDIIYTIEYICTNRTRDYALVQEVEKITKLSDNSVELRLTAPNALFVSKLTFPIVKKDSKTAVYPCGTGMYRFKEVTNTGSYVFELNNLYHKDKSGIRQLTFTSYSDESSLLQSGSDFMIVDNALSINSIVAGAQTYLLQQNTYCCLVPSPGLSGTDLVSANIRKAISNSLDRENIIKNVVSGYARSRYIPLADKTFFWQNDMSYAQEDDLSVSISSLGYESPVKMVICVDINDHELRSVADICALQLNTKGFEVEVITYENEEQLQTIEYSYMLTRAEAANSWEFSPIFAENEI